MGDGIKWLADWDGWLSDLTFARGVPPEELAVRLAGIAVRGLPPFTDEEAWEAVAGGQYRPDEDGDGMIRVGLCAGWSFAVEYGHSTGTERLVDVSRGGVEAVHLSPMPEHPPGMFAYARDGQEVCSFGIGEERLRWGRQPDLLVPDLVAAGVLDPGGDYAIPGDGPFRDHHRRTIAVIEGRFGLSLPGEAFVITPLPAFVVRGRPDLPFIDGQPEDGY